MRKLGSLLQLFNEKKIPCIKYKNGLDMLLPENFDVLKMCIEARTLTDDLKVKAGLLHNKKCSHNMERNFFSSGK